MNVNFGIMDPAPVGTPKNRKKEFLGHRALEAARAWKSEMDSKWDR